MATNYEVRGDAQPAAIKSDIAVFDLPRVAQADIEDKTAAINLSIVSGKALGTSVLMKHTTGDGYDLAVASGPADVDPWVLIAGASSATALTLTEAGDVGDAAGITVQMNLIENAFNALVAGYTITPA